jgi:ribosome-binding factor A
MAGRRADRIAVRVQEEVTRLLREGVADPRVGNVSVIGVSVNDDLSVAIVRWLPFGGVGNRVTIGEGLKAVAPMLRGPVGRSLGIRHSPELRFELDRNVEYAAHIDDIFAKLVVPPPEEEE